MDIVLYGDLNPLDVERVSSDLDELPFVYKLGAFAKKGRHFFEKQWKILEKPVSRRNRILDYRPKLGGGRPIFSFQSVRFVGLVCASALWQTVCVTQCRKICARISAPKRQTLPYKFDVVAYGLVNNPELREHIERVGVNI